MYPVKSKGTTRAMTRAVAWLQILIILCFVGYSTYSLFKGHFEQAFLPYPILIIYYLLFARRKTKATSSTESKDNSMKY